jgi:ABC-type lipoprotein export system ATPase subunit
MIRIDAVSKHYAGRCLFDSVSLVIERGDIVCVKGFSGSGKTTLLHILGGLEDPDTGEVHINGKLLKQLPSTERQKMWQEDLGFVFQDAWLIPEFLVWENVALKGFAAGFTRSQAYTRACELLEYFGLLYLSDRTVTGLSGGEKQRIALARALFLRPQYLLADEPTSALDDQSTSQFMQLLERAVRDYTLGVFLVSHDQRLYERIHRIYYFLDGKLLHI